MKEKIVSCLKEIKGNGFLYDRNLISGGFLNSFDIFELVIKLEEAFDVKIELQKIVPENLNSVEDMEKLIRETINGESYSRE